MRRPSISRRMAGRRWRCGWDIGSRSIFDFFSPTPFDPAALASEIPYLAGAEQVQVVSHSL